VRTLVELLEVARWDRPAAGLPPIVLERAQALVRCDEIGFVDFDPASRQAYLDQVGAEVVIDPDYGDDDTDPFWANYWNCKFCSYPSLSGDDRTVITISDYYSQRQWHQSGMYRDCLTETEHEAITLHLRATGTDQALASVPEPRPGLRSSGPTRALPPAAPSK
jgi:hypothetical protein